MVKTNHVQKAQIKVDKAMSVFSKAISEVEKAQSTLQDGISLDEASISKLLSLITNAKEDIELIDAGLVEKKAKILENEELISRLVVFGG